MFAMPDTKKKNQSAASPHVFSILLTAADVPAPQGDPTKSSTEAPHSGNAIARGTSSFKTASEVRSPATSDSHGTASYHDNPPSLYTQEEDYYYSDDFDFDTHQKVDKGGTMGVLRRLGVPSFKNIVAGILMPAMDKGGHDDRVERAFFFEGVDRGSGNGQVMGDVGGIHGSGNDGDSGGSGGAEAEAEAAIGGRSRSSGGRRMLLVEKQTNLWLEPDKIGPQRELFDKSGETGFFLLPDSFHQCPASMYVSKERCTDAGLALGGKLRDGRLKEGSWDWTPFGCSIQHGGDLAVHYNFDRNGQNNGGYQPVCSKGEFTLLPGSFTGGCPAPMNVNRDDCVAAGLSVGGKLNGGELTEVSQEDAPFAPFGCSLSVDDDTIHYNTKEDGVNDGRFSSLCHKLLGTQWHSGWNPGLSQAQSPSFSEENGGYSAQGAIAQVRCYGGRCDNKVLKYYPYDPYAKNSYVANNHLWTGWFSEEYPSEKNCPDDHPLVSQIRCGGGYCDNMRLKCSTLNSGFRAITSSKSDTNYFSEELNAFRSCPNGYLLNGIRCKGKHCDGIKLRCVKVEYATYHPACSPITLTATYATTGVVRYNQSPTYEENYYPTGTVATFTCPYHPFGAYLDSTTCREGSGWDKYPENECTSNTPVATNYRLLPGSFHKCPAHMYLSKDDCISAGLELEGTLRNGNLVEGSWGDAPFGCFISNDDLAIHYNSNRNGQNGGRFQPVCSKGEFTLLPRSFTGGCPASMNISRDDCVASALSVGGRLNDGKLTEVSNIDAPFGCSLSGDDDTIHYNTENGVNNGDYSSLCHKLPVSSFDNVAYTSHDH